MRVLLRHWVGEVEREPVPVGLPLGESERLREAHTVGVWVLHNEPLCDEEPLAEGSRVAEGHCERVSEALAECVGEGLKDPQGEGEGESEVLLDSVTESVALPQPLGVPEGVAPGLSEKKEPEGEAVAAKLPLRECVALEVTQCDGESEVAADALAADEGVRVPEGESLKEVVAVREMRGVRLGLMLAVRPHVENIVTVGVVLPVGGVGPANAETVTDSEALRVPRKVVVTCSAPPAGRSSCRSRTKAARRHIEVLVGASVRRAVRRCAFVPPPHMFELFSPPWSALRGRAVRSAHVAMRAGP